MGSHETTIMLVALVVVAVCIIQWRAIIHYRTLCVKLTKTVKEMYCKHEGCTNLKYYTTPIDDKKGQMTNYCSVHLMERVENGEST